MKSRFLFALCACAIALAIGASGAAADNTITITNPLNGVVYSGPTGNNPFVASWTMTINFPEDNTVTFADPMCAVYMHDLSGTGQGWDCVNLAPTGLPNDGVFNFDVDRFASTGTPTHVSAQSVFTYDTHAPVVTTTPAVPLTNGFTQNKLPVINYTATDLTLDTVTCKIDAAPATDCSTATAFTPAADLAEGSHSFTVTATDEAGYTQNSTFNFAVDTIPPLIAIIAPTPNQFIDASNPDLSLSVTGGTAQCKYDDAPYQACDAAFAALTLPDGPHSLTVLATDLAGNTSSAFVLFTIDASLDAPAVPPPSGTGIAPKSAKFTAGKAKAGKSGATKRSIGVALALPAGTNASAVCRGTAKLALSAKAGKRTKTFKKSLALKAKGGKCAVNAIFVLPKSFRNKRVNTKISFPGNAYLGRFSFRGSFRN
jgi:hypothetical protein